MKEKNTYKKVIIGAVIVVFIMLLYFIIKGMLTSINNIKNHIIDSVIRALAIYFLLLLIFNKVKNVRR